MSIYMLAGFIRGKRWLPLLWGSVWVLLSLLSWRIPPLQSPDELQHLGHACALSLGHWRLQEQPGQPARTIVDSNMAPLAKLYLQVVVDSRRRLTEAEQGQMETLRWSGQTMAVVLPGAGYYFPVVYAPVAAGLALGRLLGLGILDSYRLAKVVSIGTVLGLLAMAMRYWRLSALVCALLCLPMSLFQLLAPVPDGIANGLTVLALSVFMCSWNSALAGSPRGLSVGPSLILMMSLLVLTGSRPHMLPMLALPWWLWWQSRKQRGSGQVLLMSIVCTALVVLWWAQALGTTIDPRVQRTLSTAEIARWYAADPQKLLEVIWRTVSDPNISRFYLESFIGILGWLDTRLPGWAYPTLSAGLLLMVLLTVGQWLQPPDDAGDATANLEDMRRAIVLSLIGGASALLILLATLVSWSPHPARVIEGVQGRYFMGPALVCAFAWLPSRSQSNGHLLNSSSKAVSVLLSLTGLIVLAMTINIRYH